MLRIRLLGLDLFGCHEALARLDDFIDRELNRREMKQVALHLKICGRCASKFALEGNLAHALREKMQRLDAPESLKRNVAHALQQHLQQQNQNEGEPPATSGTTSGDTTQSSTS
jgi:anti-sigma factor (TIGR02949 family)